MPLEGINSSVEIFKQYEKALFGIEKSTHIIVLFFMSVAKRDVLQTKPRKVSTKLPKQGVFALRSPSRPNPIGFSVVKIIKRNANVLEVEGLDAIDGTPVIDIKPYSHGLDCFFSARREDEYLTLINMDRDKALNRLLEEASNFHGDTCIGIAIGTRIAYEAMLALKTSMKNKNVIIECGLKGCLADAIQAISAATNKRFFRNDEKNTVIFKTDEATLTMKVSDEKVDSIKDALDSPLLRIVKTQILLQS